MLSTWFATKILSGGGSAPNEYTLATDGQTYATSATDATLKAARILGAAFAAYTAAAQAATLRRGVVIGATGAGYAETASAATLRAARRLSSANAAYIVTAQPVALKYARRMPAVTAGYLDNAAAALLLKGYRTTAAGAAYLETSTAAAIKAARRLGASEYGALLAADAAALAYVRKIVAESAAYATTGIAVDFEIRQGQFKLAVNGSVYAYAAADAGFAWYQIPPRIVTGTRSGFSQESTSRNNLTDGVRNGAKTNNAAGAIRDNRGNQEARPRGVFSGRRRIP